MNKLLYLCVFSFLFSCSEQKVEKNILTETQMIDALIEVHLLESAYKMNLLEGVQVDSFNLKDYYTALFQSKPYTIDEFRSSFDYYAKHPKIMESLLDSTLTRIQMVQ